MPPTYMKHEAFLKSVAVISIGGFIAKGIGALYRIPLTGLLGGYGMGLYQMAYPFFCVLLTFSSAGIPSAFSRIVAREAARGRESDGAVRTALKLFASLGLGGTLLMCLFASSMGGLQGDGNLFPCYLALAPSVFLVALIAVFRGYFQGKNNMIPTAASEIVEQLTKAPLGLFFALFYRNDPVRAASLTLAAVSFSELCALGYLALRYRAEPRRKQLCMRRETGYDILIAALPVMAASALLPLSQMADSVIIVRLLSRHTARAVALYGLFAGGAVTLVNLPATVCYGLVAATVPTVAACFAKGNEEGGKRRAVYALFITLLLSVPSAIILFLCARPIVGILYRALSAEDAAMLVRLLRLSSVSAATLAGVDTLSACLTGMGQAKRAAGNMLVAVIVKLALQFVLIPVPAIGVAGAAIASNVCYLVAFSLDLFYTVRKSKRGKLHDHNRKSWDGERGTDPAGIESAQSGGRSARAHRHTPAHGGT